MAFVLIIARSLVALNRRYSQATAVFDKKLAAARKSGLVVDMARMQAPLPPESQNAAPIYVLLTQKLKVHPISDSDSLAEELSSNPPDADIKSAQEVLSRQSDILTLVHQAAAKPDCVFVRNWKNNNPPQMIFPEYASIRAGARLLRSESCLMAARGDAIGAVRNATLGFQIARHAESDHILISFLVATAVNAITLSDLQRIMYLSHGDPRVALAVRHAVEKNLKLPDLTTSLKGETTDYMADLELVRQMGPAGLAWISGSSITPGLSRSDSVIWDRFVDLNGSRVLDEMSRAVAASQLPNPAALEAVEPVKADIDKMSNDPAPTFAIAVVLLGASERSAQRLAQSQAEASETIAGAAVLCYKGVHGSFPTSLDQAITPVPMDPFDGKPLRYKREGDGFVVYSVGPDGKFDGGTPTVSPGQHNVFRYPWPVYQRAKFRNQTTVAAPGGR